MRTIMNLPEEDRTTDIGNMHRKIGKDRACGSGDILADRQTDTHTQTYMQMHRHTHHNTSPRAPAGEVTIQYNTMQ